MKSYIRKRIDSAIARPLPKYPVMSRSCCSNCGEIGHNIRKCQLPINEIPARKAASREEDPSRVLTPELRKQARMEASVPHDWYLQRRR